MPTLSIDNQQVTVEPGATILDAARAAGVDIPTLCHAPDCTPQNSCLVCVVRVDGKKRLMPACSTPAGDGMVVESESDTVRTARRCALELLLSDHAGDCIGPCQNACPANMDIPLMIRQIIAGDLRSAVETIKRDIPLPGVISRICPAPCQAGCRQKQVSQTIAIRLLVQFVADWDRTSGNIYVAPRKPPTGKRIAIIGSGVTGLTGAYYLQQAGHDCTVFDQYSEPGGRLRSQIPEKTLPRDVLDAEIEIVRRLGAAFNTNVRFGEQPDRVEIRRQFDAVLIVAGQLDWSKLGIELSQQGIIIDKATHQTNLPDVFAAGSAVRPVRLAVRKVADAKAAAVCIDQFVAGNRPVAPEQPFSTRIGRLLPDELQQFQAADGEPKGPDGSLTGEEAVAEAGRCLRCDCRAADYCALRKHAAAYGAKPGRYKGPRRRLVVHHRPYGVIFEPGRCIACGLCVRITQQAGEPLGVTFVGRGFDVRVGIPFDGGIDEGLGEVARECIDACPTGAISFADAASGPPEPPVHQNARL